MGLLDRETPNLPSKYNFDYPKGGIPPSLLDLIKTNIKSVEKKAKESKERITNFSDEGLSIPYAKLLNQEQLSAVVETEGPMLVIAGAGSGKTRVIVHKVCYLIEKKVPPHAIALLTFTKKAAHEMLDRVKKISLSDGVQKVSGGTFHSFASRLLRQFHKYAEIDPTFSIIDTADSADIISLMKNSLNLKKNPLKSLFPNKNQLQDIISSSRNKGFDIPTIIADEHPKLLDYVSDIKLIGEKYESYKRRANLFDYDDILEIFKDKLKNNEKFRQRVHDQYKYFLVDEYQDTNKVQREILKLLSSQSKNITVVGDDAQSIYAFRGANFENILSFSKDFPDGKVVKVERNYRSTEGILKFTNSVINNALMGYSKHLYTDKVGGMKPQALKFYDEEMEAKFIVGKIEELYSQDNKSGKKLSEIAVLYRSSWQSNFIQKELLTRRIPFVIVGGIKFIERKHIKDLLSFLRVTENRKDSPAWTRLLNMLDGVGEKTLFKIIEVISEEKDLKKELGKKKYFDDLAKIVLLIEQIKSEEDIESKFDLIFDYYFPFLDRTEEDSEIRKNDLHSLKKMAATYGNISDFLNDFSLDPPNRAANAGEVEFGENENDYVTLSTIHSAKGLEWGTVFVIHSLDGLLPSYRAVRKVLELEEERRLFYVACTRAKNNLFITMPSFSMSFDQYFSFPSRFLSEAQEGTFEYKIE